MAVGDYDWFVARAWSKLPANWFPDDHPVVGAIIGAIAWGGATAYALLDSVSAQARIATSSGIYLELSAADHLGPGNFPRRAGEPDDSYRARIIKERFRPLGTPQAMHDVLNDLVGAPPTIFEPALDGATFGDAFFNDPGSLLGTYSDPWTVYIDVPRPLGDGIPATMAFFADYLGSSYAASEALLESSIEDAEIERAVLKTLPAGIKGFLRIGAVPYPRPVPPHGLKFNNRSNSGLVALL